MTLSMNNQVQVSVEDLMETLNSVQAEEAVKTRTGITPRPEKAKGKDEDVLGFFRDMFANSQAKAVEAREAIQPEMYRLAKDSAYEVSQARQMAGITRSLADGGGEMNRTPLPEGTTLRPVARPPMTTMRDVTGTDEGKLDNEQPLRDLASAVANEQIPSTQLKPVIKDEADEIVNALVDQLLSARRDAGKDPEESAPVTAERSKTEGGLMSRQSDTKETASAPQLSVPEELLAPKSAAYRDADVVRNSYYKKPIKGQGPRGLSRRGGDASKDVQQAAINAIITAGRDAGMSNEDIALTLAIARHESGFNPDAAAGTTSAHGLGQFINKTGSAYGLNDDNRWDIKEQARALVAHTQDNIRLTERKGQGREYVYAYHHDGPSLKYGGLGIGKKNVTPRVAEFLKVLGDPSKEVTTTPKESLRPNTRPERTED